MSPPPYRVPLCIHCAREGKRTPATWAVVGGRWPPAEGEPDLPFRREMRERGGVMALLCERHAAEWSPSWGLGLRTLAGQ